MNAAQPDGSSAVPIAAARQIDAACDRLEQALKSGEAYSLDDFLPTVDPAAQPTLIRQFLLLELEYAQRRSGNVDITHYVIRFPYHAALINKIVQEDAAELTVGNKVFNDADAAVSKHAALSMQEWHDLGYTIQGRLGQGGMCTVYLANHQPTEQLVAVKVLRHGMNESDSLKRFRREIQTLTQLQHPNIADIFEIGAHQGRPFYSMEYCPAGSLADLLNGRRLTTSEAAALVETLARAVHVVHKANIIHRDLKPGNVLLHGHDTTDGVPIDDFIPRIADFGLATELSDTTHTQTGATLGTPQYMAPEQARGDNKSVSAAVDIHALGIILYECLTGRPPYLGETIADTVRKVDSGNAIPLRHVDSQIPRDLETICQTCLRHEPKARYADAESLADDLKRFRHGDRIKARPPGVVDRTRKWVERHRTFAAAAGMLALFLIAMPLVAPIFLPEQPGLEEAEARLALVMRDAAQSQFDEALYARDVGDRNVALLKLADSLQAAVETNAKDLERSIRRHIGAERRDLQTPVNVFPEGNHVFSVAFSSDGKRVLTGSSGNMARLWDAETGQQVGSPFQHEDTVFAVAFSPVNTQILTGSADHTAQLWDAATGQRLGPPLKHSHRVLAVAFSPDGKTVLTGSHDTTARLWNANSGEAIGEPIRDKDIVRCVKFSPDGNSLLTAGDDGIARLWDAKSLKPTGTSFQHSAAIFAACFSPDGKLVLTGSDDTTAQLWNVETGERIGQTLEHMLGRVTALDFSADGRTVVTASADATVRLWDVATGIHVGTIRHPQEVRAAVFGTDGSTVLTGGFDGVVRLYPATRPIILPHSRDVRAVAFSPDGWTIQTMSRGASVHWWDAATGDRTKTVAHPSDVLPFIGRFSFDGKQLLYADRLDSIRLSNFADNPSDAISLNHDAKILAAAFSADGTMVLTGATDNTAQLWDAATGQSIGSPLLHDAPVSAVAFSPDGQTIATGTWGRKTRLWNTATARRLGPTLEHPGGVFSLAFRPDSQILFTGVEHKSQQAGQGQLWNFETGERIGSAMRHGRLVWAADFSPDGDTIVTAGGDTVRLWDVATGKTLGSPIRHPELVMTVAFSPNGKSFLTGCNDRMARLWSVPQPTEDLPDDVIEWAQVVAGLEPGRQGDVQKLEAIARTSTEQTTKRRSSSSSDVDHRVAERVIALGGSVDVTDQKGQSFETGRKEDLPNSPFHLMWVMMPRNERVTDQLVTEFQPLQELVGIDLFQTPLTDEGAIRLAKIESLEAVYIHSTKVGDRGAIALAQLPMLRTLIVSGTLITDEALAALAGSRTLQRVDFSRTAITGDGMKHLASIPFLNTINLGNTTISDEALKHLSSLRRLEELYIGGSRVTGGGLHWLDKCPLKKLRAAADQLTPADIARFEQQHPDCYLHVE